MVREYSIRRRMLFAGAAGVTTAAALPGAARAADGSGEDGSAGGAGTVRAARGRGGADVVEPDIDGTEEWGARPPDGAVTVLPYQPSMIIIHHTVSENTTDVSRAQAHAHAHWVQDLHIDGNGWTDTGYNFIVSRGGWITEGRHQSLATLTGGSGFVLGAHTSGQNNVGIGIANEGAYHDGEMPPEAQWESLAGLCAYACQQYGILPTELYGHRDFGTTLCPGAFHDMLPRLRDEVAELLRRSRAGRPEDRT